MKNAEKLYQFKGEKIVKKIFFSTLALFFAIASITVAAEFSADEITTVAGKIKGKIYYKNIGTHRNESMGMIRIIKLPLVYQLFTDTKKYTVSNINDLESKNPMAKSSFEDIIKKNNMKKVGTDKIQNFKCDIYEGNINFTKNEPPMHMKIWYSKKLKYAIKTNMTLPAPMGSMSFYLENIKIKKQPDHLFEIPPGYSRVETIQEAMGMGMGMGNIKPPAIRNDGEKMPSEEDIRKMMEKMMKQ